MRKQAVAPSRAPMVMEPAASKTGLPVTCTSSVAMPAAAAAAHHPRTHINNRCCMTCTPSTAMQAGAASLLAGIPAGQHIELAACTRPTEWLVAGSSQWS